MVEAESVANMSLTASTIPPVGAAVSVQITVSSGESESEISSLLIPSLDSQRWDTRYHSLPSLISRSEHEQIAEKIDGFSERLLVRICLYVRVESPFTCSLCKEDRLLN
jgi:hypothetical protein